MGKGKIKKPGLRTSAQARLKIAFVIAYVFDKDQTLISQITIPQDHEIYKFSSISLAQIVALLRKIKLEFNEENVQYFVPYKKSYEKLVPGRKLSIMDGKSFRKFDQKFELKLMLEKKVAEVGVVAVWKDQI